MNLPADFYFQYQQPQVKRHFDWGWLRRTSWRNIERRDGRRATWVSWWFFGHLQWYHGTAKCDGSKSYESLAEVPGRYVMTDKPDEMLALRWRTNGPSAVKWDNMGGA
jgi:hypothetical protein